METWQRLKALQTAAPQPGAHRPYGGQPLQSHRFSEIYEGLQFLEPDSYITEVAEERVELDTVGWGITPLPDEYAPIADFLSQQAGQAPAHGIARFTQAFRAHYYQLAKRVLHERDQVIACYAGWASCHIAPNGDLWSCCIRAEPVGNLRDHDYDIAPHLVRRRPWTPCAAASAQGVRLPHGQRQLRQHAAASADGGQGRAGRRRIALPQGLPGASSGQAHWFQHQFAQHDRSSILLYRRRLPVGCRHDALRGVPHGHGVARRFQHRDIVVAVARRQHPRRVHAQHRTQPQQPLALVAILEPSPRPAAGASCDV